MPANIPKHAIWMQQTALGVTRPRSTALKDLDEAIRQYDTVQNESNLFRIRNKFEDWKRSKGPGNLWQANDRNRSGAMTRLEAELVKFASYTNYQQTHFTQDELRALQFIRQQRLQVIRTVFSEKSVKLKGANLVDKLRGKGAEVEKTSLAADQAAKKSGKSAAGPSTGEKLKEKLIDTAKDYFGVEGLEMIGSLGSVILGIIGKTALSVPPVVGHVKDGYDLFTGWAKVGKLYVHQRSIGDRNYAIDTGAPAAAFGAVMDCLKDETKNEAVGASIATTSFALKTGLAAVDGGVISGPVVGAVAALAEFMHTLALLAIEWRATKKVNEALASDQLDIRLFRTYPLMGCYLMVSATLSDLIPIDSFGTPGWMDYIESMKKHQFDAIYKASTDLIDSSHWEIMGLPKRAAGTSTGIFDQGKRIWSAVSPLKDLYELKDLKS